MSQKRDFLTIWILVFLLVLSVTSCTESSTFESVTQKSTAANSTATSSGASSSAASASQTQPTISQSISPSISPSTSPSISPSTGNNSPIHAFEPRRDRVDDFLKLADEIKFDKLPRFYPDDSCANITPPLVFEKTGCLVFKYAKSSAAFLQVGRQIFVLGESFGGHGLTDLQLCDFDRDGRLDLIYTYSWGSGLHRSHVDHFNLSTLAQSRLNFTNMNGDLYLSMVADDHFELYQAAVSIENGDFARISLTRRELLASVRSIDGVLQVIEK